MSNVTRVAIDDEVAEAIEAAGGVECSPEPQPIPLDEAVQAVERIAAKLRADLQRSEMPQA